MPRLPIRRTASRPRALGPLLVLLAFLYPPATATPLEQGGAANAVAVTGEEAVGPGCRRGNRFYRPETTWQEDDGCLSCSCDRGGHVNCQAFMCQVTCDNPRRVQGECCPVCDGQSIVTQPWSCPSLGNCTLKCTHGFVVEEGCLTCQCQQGAACTLECPVGYARDTAGNELCECTCPAMGRCSKRCTHGYRKDASGCSQCACLAAETNSGEEVQSKNCTDTAGGGRDDGEYWSDGCRGCYCAAGRTLCELASCKDDPSALRRVAELALCSDDKVTGLLAGCVSCSCLRGRALCEVAACPPAACPDPQPPDRMGCCPTCPNNWPRDYIPPLPTGSSSPPSSPSSSPTSPWTCAEGPGSLGRAHDHGTSWRLSDCSSCRCDQGRVECFEQRCPALQCDLQFTPKGMCCPVCLGERGAKPVPLSPPPFVPPPPAGGKTGRPSGQAAPCWWRNQSHAAAEEWFPDECTRCQCDPAGSGSSTCTQVVCPGCTNQPEYCCPACSDGAGGVPLLVTLAAVSVLLVLLVLALGYFVWQRGRRQSLDIARADSQRPSRPPATYTYNMIPTEKPLAR